MHLVGVLAVVLLEPQPQQPPLVLQRAELGLPVALECLEPRDLCLLPCDRLRGLRQTTLHRTTRRRDDA